MLTIRLLYIGKTKFRWVQSGVSHYQREMKKFAKLDIVEVKAVTGRYPDAELMAKEVCTAYHSLVGNAGAAVA